jgi:hypothetical protein
MANAVKRPAAAITFSPAWWHARYGISFAEPVWADPIARTELDRSLRRLLFERFGDVGLGEPDPAPRPNIEAYGHRFMAAVWGCEVRYFADQSPAAVSRPDADRLVQDLRGPEVAASPVVHRALAEARTLQRRYGACSGAINLGGPLNNAVSVLGEAVLEVLGGRPDTGRAVLDAMAQALIQVYEQVTCVIDRTSPTWPRPAGGIGNCPVCMVSPRTYREVVLPADQWYRNHFRDFSVHHCGALHPYAEVYRELRPSALDVGWLSDRRRVREVYLDTPLSLMLEASVLAGKSRAEVDAIVAGMVAEAAPASLISSIWVAEAGTEVDDATVRDFMTAMSRVPLPAARPTGRSGQPAS